MYRTKYCTGGSVPFPETKKCGWNQLIERNLVMYWDLYGWMWVQEEFVIHRIHDRPVNNCARRDILLRCPCFGVYLLKIKTANCNERLCTKMNKASTNTAIYTELMLLSCNDVRDVWFVLLTTNILASSFYLLHLRFDYLETDAMNTNTNTHTKKKSQTLRICIDPLIYRPLKWLNATERLLGSSS